MNNQVNNNMQSNNNQVENIEMEGIPMDNISQLRKEIIKEYNGNIYYHAEYIGLKIIIRDDGYINATKLCKLALNSKGNPKEYADWKTNLDYKELMPAISDALGIPSASLEEYVASRSIIMGTYVHPDVAVHAATWASKQFAIRVSRIVNNYAIKQAVEQKQREIAALQAQTVQKDDKIDTMQRKIDELLARTDHIINQNDNLEGEVGGLRNEVGGLRNEVGGLQNEVEQSHIDVLDAIADNQNNLEIIQEALGIAPPVIPANSPDVTETFGVFENTDGTFQMVRTQKKRFRLQKKKRGEPVLEITNQPNAINLSIRIKDDLSDGRVTFKYNQVILETITISEFVDEVNRINEEQFQLLERVMEEGGEKYETMYTGSELEAMKKTELMGIAKHRIIHGRSGKTKSVLILMILQDQTSE